MVVVRFSCLYLDITILYNFDPLAFLAHLVAVHVGHIFELGPEQFVLARIARHHQHPKVSALHTFAHTVQPGDVLEPFGQVVQPFLHRLIIVVGLPKGNCRFLKNI